MSISPSNVTGHHLAGVAVVFTLTSRLAFSLKILAAHASKAGAMCRYLRSKYYGIIILMYQKLLELFG